MTTRRISEPTKADLDKIFTEAMQAPPRRPVPVDRNADAVDITGLTLVCLCGKPWLHEDRCARCGARNGSLVCGRENNHRGRHQAIALWGADRS